MSQRKTAKKKAGPKPNLDHIAEALRPLAVAVAELSVDPQNARTHDKFSVAATAASLAEFGQLKPVVANRDGQLLAGNGMFAAAKQLGWTHLAVVYGQLDEKAQRGFSIADNRTAELAGWDFDLLSTQIGLLEDDQADLIAALQLLELQRDLDESGEKAEKIDEKVEQNETTDDALPEHFQVVIECEDEADQKATYEKLQAEGRTCRLLTL